MERIRLEGVTIAYRVDGHGPPVILIHAAGLADFFAPLHDSRLQCHAQLISYHRAGYGLSGAAPAGLGIPQQAEHCGSLLQHLGVERAHVVGHSSGGLIAIEFAMRFPEQVATLSLLEPSLRVHSSADLVTRVMQPAFAAYLAGDKAAAIDAFLAGVGGPDYPALVELTLPRGARRQAAVDADTVFVVEAPSVGRWDFEPRMLSDVRIPVLSVLGERSDEVSLVSREAHELLLALVPDIEGYVLPRATHFLQLQNPNDLADRLIDFFGRHPI